MGRDFIVTGRVSEICQLVGRQSSRQSITIETNLDCDEVELSGKMVKVCIITADDWHNSLKAENGRLERQLSEKDGELTALRNVVTDLRDAWRKLQL